MRPVAYCSGCDCSIEVTCMPAASLRPFEPLPHATAAAANPSSSLSVRNLPDNHLSPLTPSPPSSVDYEEPLPAPRSYPHETPSDATNLRQRPFADDAKRPFVPWGRGGNPSNGPQQTAVVGRGSPRAAGVHSSVLRSSTVFGDREVSSTSDALGGSFRKATAGRCDTRKP